MRAPGSREACSPGVRLAMEGVSCSSDPMWHRHPGAREHDTHLERTTRQLEGWTQAWPESEARLRGTRCHGI